MDVEFAAIAGPVTDFQNNREPLEATLRHEQYITSLIHDLTAKRATPTISAPVSFWNGSLPNRARKEKQTGDLIAKFDLFGDDARSLYLLNAELKGRA